MRNGTFGAPNLAHSREADNARPADHPSTAPTTPRAAARLTDLLVASAEAHDLEQLTATINATLIAYPPAAALELVVIPSLGRLKGACREHALVVLNRPPA